MPYPLANGLHPYGSGPALERFNRAKLQFGGARSIALRVTTKNCYESMLARGLGSVHTFAHGKIFLSLDGYFAGRPNPLYESRPAAGPAVEFLGVEDTQ
jgi:hypothetical protein